MRSSLSALSIQWMVKTESRCCDTVSSNHAKSALLALPNSHRKHTTYHCLAFIHWVSFTLCKHFNKIVICENSIVSLQLKREQDLIRKALP